MEQQGGKASSRSSFLSRGLRFVLPVSTLSPAFSGVSTEPDRSRTAEPENGLPELKRTAINTIMIVGVKGAISSLNLLIDRFDKTNQNASEMDALLRSFESLDSILQNFYTTKSPLGNDMTGDLKKQITSLTTQLRQAKDQSVVDYLQYEITILKKRLAEDHRLPGPEISDTQKRVQELMDKHKRAKEKIESARGHSKARRYVDAIDDAGLIMDQYRSLDASIKETMLGAILSTEYKLAEQHAFDILDKLPRAKDARYEHVDRPKCSPGTREDVLRQINHWIEQDPEHQIYWLNGGAGTGKTTVALTLAHSINRPDKFLSASFFCSRDISDRSNIRNIIPTLAYVLAQCNIHFRNELVRVIRGSPDVGYSLPQKQFHSLILQPLLATGLENPVVLVLDALDECSNVHAPETIISAFASAIAQVPFLKIFVSSRPTSSTNDAFADEELRKRRAVFVLHDVEKDVVESDIKSYISARLADKALKRNIAEKGWPPVELVEKLVQKADGLFIYASTVCEFIEHRGDLQYRLQQMADRPAREYKGIDALYQQILDSAIAEFTEEEDVLHCRSIVTAVVQLQNPLPLIDLGDLLQLPANHIRELLGDLQSVLIVPEKLHGIIHTLHASFHDFLTDEKRCLPRMYVRPSRQHRDILMRLLQCMNTLKRDICKISFQFNAEVHHLETRRKTYISGSLLYACSHWIDHLSLVSTTEEDDELLEALHTFVSTKLLNWIEVLSLLDNLSNALTVLASARSWYARAYPSQAQRKLEFDELVADVCTLLPGYLPVVKQCASQVYCTLLSFATPELRLRRVYDQTSNAPFFVTFSSSISGINSLGYSIDGNIVASGFLDGSISMWDSEADSQTILPLATWQAHSRMVLAITFSPDGTNIVSVSSDGTLKIWDVQTRSLQMSLELPSERTTIKRTDSRASLAFSAKGTLLAFTSLYSRKIWSTKTWKEKRFDGPGYNVINGGHCIVLSPDTNCFAVADAHGIYVFDLDGLHYIVRDRKSHRHLVFNDDGTMIRSTQGTYDVITSERVESLRHRNRFSEDLYVDKGWLIDKDGQKRCWIPESPREGDFYAAHGNKIVFAGNGRLIFLKLGTLSP